jgi:hypothetical protein
VTPGLALAACAPTANRTSRAATAGPATFGVIQTVLELVPGTFTVMQTHGGQGDLTVLEGELTLRSVGVQRKINVEETSLLSAGVFAQRGNLGSGRAQHVTAVVLPNGAALTTHQGLAAPS